MLARLAAEHRLGTPIERLTAALRARAVPS
jgi:hypothetical protein